MAAAAALAVSLWLQNRPPAPPSPSPSPARIPAASAPSRRAGAASTAPTAVPPTPAPDVTAGTFGAVFEVTVPRPRATPTPEVESPPFDLRRVDQKDVTAPVLVYRVEPTYPEIARRGRAEGVVVVEAVIDERGEVEDPRVVQSNTIPLLNEQALRAVRQWRYRPAAYRGKPVRVYVTVSVTFRLN